ncbi:MAG: TIGR03905 family TSCPD domain-containing protein [Muribaculaceae bacterium]|nr:TIGR03905 family TSCPD domain-containing protein [Muribaculaceae bacterium]
MKYTYNTWGTCSRLIDFEIQDGVIKNVVFTGGCNGNLQGIARLVEGMTPTQAISKLEGIHCGSKPTSCPDQLAQALKQALDS